MSLGQDHSTAAVTWRCFPDRLIRDSFRRNEAISYLEQPQTSLPFSDFVRSMLLTLSIPPPRLKLFSQRGSGGGRQ